MAIQDQYERYYAEKIWSMIPAVYQAEDALEPGPGVLRQIVEVIADQAAITRRSIDRLWEDQHIETCDDWAVPYIADLVGTRLLPALDSRARRVDVARTVHFRRRRGTPSLLEQLVRELSGWDVVLVEAYRRLARAPHRLDSFPLSSGRETGTPSGGTANLRSPRSSELAVGPFDEFFRTADVRRLRGEKGRYAIGKLNFHAYRIGAFELNDVTPYPFEVDGLTTFTVDPSGRDTPLFARSQPVNGSGLNACATPWALLPASGSFVERDSDQCDPRCTVTHEWQVGKEIPCRLLSDARFRFTLAQALAVLSGFTLLPNDERALRTLAGFEFRSEARLRRRLMDLGLNFSPEPDWYRTFLRAFVTSDSAKPRLVGANQDGATPRSINIVLDGDALQFDQVTGADLRALSCRPTPSDPAVRLLIDPEVGRFAVLNDAEPFVQRYFYGYLPGVGAGGYTRDLPDSEGAPMAPPPGGVLPALGPIGVMTLAGSRKYTLRLDSSTKISNAVLQADQRTRPYVLLHSEDGQGAAADLTPNAPNARITLDGVWFGSEFEGQEDFVVHPADPPGDFDWEEIVISHSTFDPGGTRADASRVDPLRIVVKGRVKTLRITGSIVGAIEVVVGSSPELSGFVERIVIENSIVDASQFTPDFLGRQVAISNVVGEVHLSGVTVFGDVHAERLFSSNSLVAGQLLVVDTQNSCFRFSASKPTSDDRIPPKYPPREEPADIQSFHFVSMRFGDPGYAQLSEAAPEVLLSGAEDGSELGAFSFLRRPIRVASIMAKIDEFKPIGILPQTIFEGEAATGTLVVL